MPVTCRSPVALPPDSGAVCPSRPPPCMFNRQLPTNILALREWRCGVRRLSADVVPFNQQHHPLRAIPCTASCFHALIRCTYCLDVIYSGWNTSTLTSFTHVRQNNISGNGFSVMKITVVRCAKALRRCIGNTTPLEWSADFSVALRRNIAPWSLQGVLQLLVIWRVTGLKLGAPGILTCLFSTSK